MLDNEPVLDISKKPLIATYPMPKKTDGGSLHFLTISPQTYLFTAKLRVALGG